METKKKIIIIGIILLVAAVSIDIAAAAQGTVKWFNDSKGFSLLLELSMI
jgi:hypothetical protein